MLPSLSCERRDGVPGLDRSVVMWAPGSARRVPGRRVSHYRHSNRSTDQQLDAERPAAGQVSRRWARRGVKSWGQDSRGAPQRASAKAPNRALAEVGQLGTDVRRGTLARTPNCRCRKPLLGALLQSHQCTRVDRIPGGMHVAKTVLEEDRFTLTTRVDQEQVPVISPLEPREGRCPRRPATGSARSRPNPGAEPSCHGRAGFARP